MRGATFRALLVVFVVAAAPSFCVSFDFGGSLLNSSGLGNYPTTASPSASPAFAQRDAGNLWFQAALSDSLLLNAQIGSGFTMYRYGVPPQAFFVDVDLANLQGTFPPVGPGTRQLRFTAGRALFSEFTGLVLGHKADGIQLGLDYQGWSVSLAAAYTGLVSKGASTIELSRTDVTDVADTGVIFAPPRLVETLAVDVRFLSGQRVSFSCLLQQDLRGTFLDLTLPAGPGIVTAGSTIYDPTRGGPVNSQYFGLGTSGSLSASLYYDAYAYLGILEDLLFTGGSYQGFTSVAALAGASARYYFRSPLYSVLGGRVLFASGDSGAISVYEGATQLFSDFLPISRPTLSYVFSPQLSNIVLVEASYSLKPFSSLASEAARNLEVRLQADAYLRPTPGAISEPGISASDSSLYLGTEADLAVLFRPFSDVGLSLWGGLFIPGSAFGASTALQYKAGFDVSLSF
jgi:hypothetical protein